MNGNVTVGQVMRRDFVGANEGDGLRETAALMLEENVDTVVVLRGAEPIGMVTQRDVLETAVERADLDGVTVADVMRSNPPTVAPGESLTTATDQMSGTDSRHLLVTEDEELAGVITEHDVVTASTLDPGVDREHVEADERATIEAATATAEGTGTGEEYSNQGICELCGTLSHDLSSFNGQLVCTDCKNV
ncbi:cyclic nucleotide-binding/CBS domain-containing protein [Halorientalis halophila]|uniref:CBS domain-containing protein n=1 Tax=Halorientalis halophila TaxID=3108499 RepID=UPI00300A3BD1